MVGSMPAELATLLDSLCLNFTLVKFLNDDTPSVQNWRVEADVQHWDDIDERGHHREEIIGHLNIVKGDLTYRSLLEDLDDLEADLMTVGSVLLNPDEGDLRDDLEESLQGVGATLLILNSVTLKPSGAGTDSAPSSLARRFWNSTGTHTA